MFTLVHHHDTATDFIQAFDKLFSIGAEQRDQWLSTPGGGFHAQVYYRSDLQIWAYIDKNIFKNRYSCWFGSGEPGWRPAIEINIPVMRTLHCFGQLVQDEAGNTYLAHRGGLGGGKYTVRSSVFSDLIDGFIRDDIVDGDRSRKYFVIGSTKDQTTLERLARYVREATRIRRLREDELQFTKAVESRGGTADNNDFLGEDFDLENDKGGTYAINRLANFKKNHAKVQRALADHLKSQKLKPFTSRLHGGIGPDIYTKNDDGTMHHLYEIKVGIDSQSIFTAIGQIAVYSTASKKVDTFLVVRGMPRSNLFKRAVVKLGIRIIFYQDNDGSITFDENRYI